MYPDVETGKANFGDRLILIPMALGINFDSVNSGTGKCAVELRIGKVAP